MYLGYFKKYNLKAIGCEQRMCSDQKIYYLTKKLQNFIMKTVDVLQFYFIKIIQIIELINKKAIVSIYKTIYFTYF